MSENIRLDNTLPEMNGDNKEECLVSSNLEDNVKFKDNNEVTTTIDEENVDMKIPEGNNVPQVDENESVPQKMDDDVGDKNEIKVNDIITTENNQNNITTTTTSITNNSSLSLLAQYNSSESDDSSSSSEEESSCTMDSDESSSISSMSSAKSLNTIKKKIDELEKDHGDEEDDDDDVEFVGEKRSKTPIKAIGELGIEDLPPIEDLHITVPEKECNLLGKITSIVDQLVLVESLPNVVPLDLESVLFLDKGQRTLGKVFDVLGQVHCPIYCVRFNTNQDIIDKGIEVGQDVYCAPSAPCTSIVILPELMKHKGSDASWKNDIEPPERFLEYSDDEQERSARRSRRDQNGTTTATTNQSESEHSLPRNGHPGNNTYQYHRARRGSHHNHNGTNRENIHHSTHNYPRPNHHHMPIANHMNYQPQYYQYTAPGPSQATFYPNPFAQPDPRYYPNPFAYVPPVNYPPFNPGLFGMPPPPPTEKPPE